MLEYGIGYEVSKSRWILAERYKELIQSKRVNNVNENFLNQEVSRQFDLIILVDNVFQMISAMTPLSQRESLRWIKEALSSNGFVFFEIEDYTKLIKEIRNNGGVLRRWEEYQTSAPFQYGLHKLTNPEGDIVVFDKVFIKRDSGKRDTFTTVVKSYTYEVFKEVLKEVLSAEGFSTHYYPYYEKDEQKREIEEGKNKRDVYRVLAQGNN